MEVQMVGDIDVLGNWDTDKAVTLKWNEELHAYSVTVPIVPATHVEFKYVYSI